MTHRSLVSSVFGKPLLITLAGATAGLTLGCIISTNGGGSSHDCDGVLSHSHETANGGCACDAGYTWENPDDDMDYACERIQPKPDTSACDSPNNVVIGDECFCEGGYIWCDPADPNDYSCCIDPAQDSLSGTGGTDDPSTTDVSDTVADTGTGTTDDPTVADTSGSDTLPGTSGAEPDPAQCTVDTPEAIFCSNFEDVGPEGSIYYACIDGVWTESNADIDASCQFDGFDFGYGCTDDGAAINFICGNGPGTACDDSTVSTCVNDDVINACLFGKLTEDSCATLCNTIGDEEGVTYESGFCDAESDPPECFCCDSGEEGCPI